MSIASLLSFNRGRELFLPAHGRGAALPKEIKQLLKSRAGVWDLPELPGLGGPLVADGAVAESQDRSAICMGAKRCWYGVNGATGLLQAALFSLARPGQAVLMPRNVHRSLIQACAIADIKPVLFRLPFSADLGHVGTPNSDLIKEVLDEVSLMEVDIAAAVLINPTYQGYSTDLAPLVDLFHQRGWPVLVDEAHGSYFASEVDKDLPVSAISAGADLIVHSLHKSAAGLVQTAALWLKGEQVDPLTVDRSVGWVQTSSPSALLLSSCEAAIREWSRSSGRKKLIERIENARSIAFHLRERGVPLVTNQDPLRLVLHTGSVGVSGFEADCFFIPRGLIAELPEPGCLTFCLGLARHRGLIKDLTSAWEDLLANNQGSEPFEPFRSPPVPKVMVPAIGCSVAWRSKSQSVPLDEAAGHVSAEMVCPYPPGIPMVVPGEALNQISVEWLLEQKLLWPDQISSELRVVCQ